jgi:hypothetical protein
MIGLSVCFSLTSVLISVCHQTADEILDRFMNHRFAEAMQMVKDIHQQD